MSTWGFGQESGQVATGANTVAGIVKGFQPHYEADGMASKRNVIVTSAGWVRRTNGTGSRAGRQFDEVVVAANPGTSTNYSDSASHMGKPDVCQMYVKLNANGYISANVSANLYVVFNTPMKVRASGNNVTINLANTAGGNNGLAIHAAGDTIAHANNTLVFTLPPLQGGTGSAKGTYQVNAQSIAVTGGGHSLYNPDAGITAAANLVITGAVANNLLDGAGARITTFQVAPLGG